MVKIKEILKGETVLIISFVLAVASMFVVTPNKGYADYIDFKTLALLSCLMAVVAGLNRIGVFDLLAKKLLTKTKSVRGLSLTLSLLCFFSSMLITNDVALITFVPFTIVTLNLSSNQKAIIPLVAIETVAANLGSMLTPIGNPQNLYLFSFFDMGAGEFIKAILPYASLSLAMVAASVIFIRQNKTETSSSKDEKEKPGLLKFMVYIVLFAIVILAVFGVLHYLIAFGLTLVGIVLTDAKIIRKIDFSLLLTFLFLFIFIGNLGEIPKISSLLESVVSGNEVAVGIIASQFFSNVPAAILLSGFTSNAAELLVGVNLGGLGTLIASMASLISFKYIAKSKEKTGKYILFFTIINIVFLVANVLLYTIIK